MRTLLLLALLCGFGAYGVCPARAGRTDGDTPQDRTQSPSDGLARCPWPSFRGGARNIALGRGSLAQPAKSWVFEPGPPDRYGFYTSPALGADGAVYIGSGSLYALDGATGKQLWEFYAGNAGFCPCSAIDAAGVVYGLCGNGNLYAIDGRTGKMRWAFKATPAGLSGPALGADGTLYFGTMDGCLYAVNTATGKERWRFQGAGRYCVSPTVGRSDLVYCADLKGCYAVEAATGKLRWSYPLDHIDCSGAPALGPDGAVYLAWSLRSDDRRSSGSITALDGETGKLKWAYHPGDFVKSTPALGADGTLYFGCGDGYIYALNSARGTLKWKFATGALVQASAAIGEDGTVYIGAYNKKFYALDGVTGAKRWEFQTGGGIQGSAAVSREGTVYFGSLDNRFYALRNGKLTP